MAQIDTPQVFDTLMQLTEREHPLWLDHNPTAVRLRGYIEKVIGWPKLGFNCAVWANNLDNLLANPKAVHKPEPHPLLHPDEMGWLHANGAADGRPGIPLPGGTCTEWVAVERSARGEVGRNRF